MEEGSSGYIRHAEVRVADAIPERNRDHFLSLCRFLCNRISVYS